MTRFKVGHKLLFGLTLLAVGLGLLLALTAPPDAVQRTYARILYIHVPTAWLAFLAFGITALGSIGWRIRKNLWWDRLAASSAEIGVLFTGLALLTGAIWGRPVWGVFFDWADPRMASTAVMFLVYCGYLALRRFNVNPVVAANRASILGIVAVVQVPLVYFSVNLFRSLHQTQSIRPDGTTMAPPMLRALLVNLVAFNMIYFSLLLTRMILARVESEARATSPIAGTAVIAPKSQAAGGWGDA
ncbi:MAG: cytochrome c biogenesis protein CcsA [Acidimicrobiia bacterium]|nr:cytochrome c biogenesis protein CcsA [Acidimicrobiia bacterium]MDQ3501793.1 cytochrome c biogenesis protein [Actinomycetota bacterium]